MGKTIAINRRARHDYEIEETFEAGIALEGSEVKSLREGKANIAESYASDENGEIYLINSYIPEYGPANRHNHAPKRHRKLLFHKREIARLAAAVSREGRTMVPLKLYFNDRGIAKLQIALAKGRKTIDKRQVVKKRDWERQKARILRENN